MKDELMKRCMRFMLFAALSLGLVSLLIVYGKYRQRETIAELMKHEFVAVQFKDGAYCESIDDVNKRIGSSTAWMWFYFDVQTARRENHFSAQTAIIPYPRDHQVSGREF